MKKRGALCSFVLAFVMGFGMAGLGAVGVIGIGAQVDYEYGSLRAYYNFEVSNAGSDVSGNKLDAEIIGNLAQTDGIYGKGLQLRGSKQNYLSLPAGLLTGKNADGSGQGEDSATISFWFKFDEVPKGYIQIMNFGNMNDDCCLRLLVNQYGEMRLEYEVPGAGSKTELVCWGEAAWMPVANVWYHTAIVIDGSANRISLYRDGAKLKEVLPYQQANNTGGDETAALNLAALSDTQNMFGYSSNYEDYYFTGVLDEFRVYGGALSGTAINELCADFATAMASPETAHYGFDEAALSADSSGNGNDLILSGGAGEHGTDAGKFGKGYSFDGNKDNHIRFPENILTKPNGVSAVSATIAFWFKFDEVPTGFIQILNFGNMEDNCRIRLGVNPMGEMRLEYEVPGAGKLTELVCWGEAEWKPAANVWYHTAIVIDGSANRISLYRDGAKLKEVLPYQKADNTGGDETAALNLASLVDTQNVFGYSSNYEDHYFTGTLDELYLFRSALSQEQIGTLKESNTFAVPDKIKMLASYEDRTVYQGETVTLSVSEFDYLSNTDVNFLWQIKRDGEFVAIASDSITGADTAALTINDILSGAVIAGQEEVILRVALSAGSVLVHSNEIVLTVCGVTAPTVTEQPRSQKANPGDTVTFTVAGTGVPDLTYRWYRGDTALVDSGKLQGSATETLTIREITEADLGAYKCKLVSMGGTVFSDEAVISFKTSARVSGAEEGETYETDVTIQVDAAESVVVYREDDILTDADFSSGSCTFSENGTYKVIAVGEDGIAKELSFIIQKAQQTTGKGCGTLLAGGTPWISMATGIILVALPLLIVLFLSGKKREINR